MRARTIALVTCLFAASSLFGQTSSELDRLVDEGRDAMYRLEYPAAREIFGRIIEQYPESPVGYGMMSNVTFNEMLLAAANPALQDYGVPSPYSGSKIYKSLDEESRRFHEATDRLIEVTDGILEEDPENVEAKYFRGLAEENLAAEAIVITRSTWSAFGHGRRANGIHKDVLELDPEFVDAQVSVAAYEFAKATLSRRLRWTICALFCRGDKDKAFEMMEEVARDGRYRDVDAQVLLTVMHAQKGDPERAVEILESLAERYPESYLVDLNLAGIQERKLEDPAEALATLEGLLESLPGKTPGLGEGEVHFRMGKTYFNMEDYEQAQAAFQSAIDSPTVELETEPLSYFYLGEIQEELDLEDEAMESYRQFVMRAGSMESLEDEVRTANRRLR